MKKLIISFALLGAIVGAQEASHLIGLYLSASGPISEYRSRFKSRCAAEKAECWLIVIEKDGRRLAVMDMEGNWIEYGARDEIADAVAAATGQPYSGPR